MKLYVFGSQRISKALLLVVSTSLLVPLSACRLGTNNTEKLDALKSGLGYDENGVVLPSPSPLAAGTLSLSAPDPVYRPGETVSLSISKQDGETEWTSLKLQYASNGVDFSDVATLSTSATSVDYVIPANASSTNEGRFRLYATDAASNVVTSEATSKIHLITQARLIAGNVPPLGTRDGVGTNARFRMPIAMVKLGTAFYVTDLSVVRKVDMNDPNNPVVTTFVGKPGYSNASVDGVGDAARFRGMYGIATDGTDLYVTDSSSIRKITVSSRTVTTLAGLPGTTGAVDDDGGNARFNGPWGLAYVSGALYVADYNNHAIRKVSLTSPYTVTTFAGLMGTAALTNADGTAARFNKPTDIATDGTALYVVDFSNRVIRKILLASPYTVTTVAGTNSTTDVSWRDDTGTSASFLSPSNLTLHAGYLYVSESQNAATIRRINLGDNVVTTYAGLPGQPGYNDGSASTAKLFNNRGLLVDGGYLYVLSEQGGHIRRISMSDQSITTIAGAPPSVHAPFIGTGEGNVYYPVGIFPSGTDLWIAEGSSHTIRKLDLGTNTLSTPYGKPGALGINDAQGNNARFKYPDHIVKVGNDFFVTDGGSHTIKRIDSSGNVSLYAGAYNTTGTTDGAGTTARFSSPYGITAIGNNTLYVADFGNHKIRKIDITNISSPVVSTIAGSTLGNNDAVGTSAKLRTPIDITTDGTNLYFTEYQSNMVKKLNLGTNLVTTLAGAYTVVGSTDGVGTAARFNNPRSLAYSGGALYITDTKNHTIRKFNLGDNSVTTLAGGAGVAALQDGTGLGARFYNPLDIKIVGSVAYISDYYNHALRKMDLTTLEVTTIAGGANVAGTVDGPSFRSKQTTDHGSTAVAGSQIFYSTPTAIYRRTSDSSSVLFAGHATQAGYVDGAATTARFTGIRSITADANFIFAMEQNANVIRKIDLNTGVVSTLAGQYGVSGTDDGIGTAAKLGSVRYGVSDGTNLYVSTSNGHTLRKIVIATGQVTTVVGTGTAGNADGVGTAAALNTPDGMVILGKTLYVACSNGQTIRKIDITNPDSPVVTTLSGTYATSGYQDGAVDTALWNGPKAMTTDGKNLYVIDDANYLVRKIHLATGQVSTFMGESLVSGQFDGTLPGGGLSYCSNGLTYSPAGFYLGCGPYAIRLH